MREQDRQLTDEQRAEFDKSLDEFREHKRQKHLQMQALQSLPYEVKVKKAKQRIREFIYGCDQLGYNTHVSVGGLDSITLLCLIRSMGIDIPADSESIWRNDRTDSTNCTTAIRKRGTIGCISAVRMRMGTNTDGDLSLTI